MSFLAASARALAYTSRGLGALQVLLGLAFWTGHLQGLVPLHVLNGLVIVALLLAATAVGAAARERAAKVVAGLLWAPFVVWLGLRQGTLLPGAGHWIVQGAHLLVGLAALALIDQLTRRARAKASAP